MGEAHRSSFPDFESRPEIGPRKAEFEPVDYFARLKESLLTEGRRPLVSADISGMEEMFEEVMRKRGFSFEVFKPEQSGGGSNYKVQRENLVKVVGEPTVVDLEEWGEKLFDLAGRKTHDASTGKTGIVVAQVVLDLYRFSAKLRTQEEPNDDHQRAQETVDKLNKRILKWHDMEGRPKSPSGCSGEIMAGVIDWMLSGKMYLPTPGIPRG